MSSKKILQAVSTNAEDVAESEAGNVTKDELEASKGLLHAVASKGFLKCTQVLVQKGADINGARKDGYTPLQAAAAGGQAVVCDFLISKGANVNAVIKENGFTCVALSVRAGALETTRLLLNAGANVDTPDKEGITPLWAAVNDNKRDLAKLLLERGANSGASRPRDKCAPIHLAVSKQFYEIVQLLMDFKADMKKLMDGNKKGEQWSPSDIAKGKGDDRMLSLLNAKTSIVMRKKDRGDSPQLSPRSSAPRDSAGGVSEPKDPQP